MAGKKGMHHKRPEQSLRRNIWRSIRIMRAFTIPGLMRTVPGASEHNIRSFLIRLNRHGVIAKNTAIRGGRPGEFQQFRLVKDVGPEYPTVCPTCGRPLSKQCEKPETETDTQTETETDTQTERAAP